MQINFATSRLAAAYRYHHSTKLYD